MRVVSTSSIHGSSVSPPARSTRMPLFTARHCAFPERATRLSKFMTGKSTAHSVIDPGDTQPAIPRSLTEAELAQKLAPVSGFLRTHEAYLLHRLARFLPENAICAEIGSWMGRSSVAIALALIPGKGILHTIDDHRGITGHEGEQPAEPILRQFLSNIETSGVADRIQHHPASSDSLASSWTLLLDFLFIDGDHRYDAVQKDLRYIQKVKPGGWIAFHDSGNPDVARAIGEWWDRAEISPARLARAGTILAIQLPGTGVKALPQERVSRARKEFFWASCEIPPRNRPLLKILTKFRQGRARAFFKGETEWLIGSDTP